MPPQWNTEFLYTRIVFITVRYINGDQVVGQYFSRDSLDANFLFSQQTNMVVEYQ